VTPHEWFVVDWDDLALGDPAVEFAVLLWPIVDQGGKWSEFSIPDVENGFRKRIEVCLRAQLLDEVIEHLPITLPPPRSLQNNSKYNSLRECGTRKP
jgi:hypothetical protein